jgi:hypothetical protein
MSEDSRYIKDVESYFISLAGEGIMLSSDDYALISKLRDRQIPKEVVLRGINHAFKKLNLEDDKGKNRIRSMRQCSSFIEECVVEYSPLKERKIVESTGEGHTGVIGEAAEKLGEFINEEKRANIRDYYIRLRNSVLELEGVKEENALGRIIKLEGDCIEGLLSTLPEKEREAVNREAEEKVKGRGRYMTEKAFTESVISFRNEIIHNKYGVRSLYSYD